MRPWAEAVLQRLAAEAADRKVGEGPCKRAGVSRGRSGCSGDPSVGVLDLEHSGLEATDAEMEVEAGCTVCVAGCRYSSLRPTNWSHYFRFRRDFAGSDRQRLGKISFSTREI